MNLLELKRRSRRRQGFYWASVIASIVVHGGFLAYVLAYARLPGQPPPQPRLAGVNVELIGTAPFAALRRGDREDAPPEAQQEEDAVKRDAAHSAAKALASQIGAPLPEDSARAVKPLPLPERLPKHRFETSPAAAGRAPAIATLIPVLVDENPWRSSATQAFPSHKLGRAVALTSPHEKSSWRLGIRARAGTGMSLPARRLPRIAAEARLSERPVADPHPDGGLTAPDAMPPPPLKLLAASEKADLAPGSEEGRASALDMGAQGSPVVAVLPKEAGIAMFAAHVALGAPMLPEDRPAAPAQAWSERSLESRPVPPPARRVARLAGARSVQAERGDTGSAGHERARGFAGARKARAYRANVRAHLAANRPAGGYGSGRAVVAFNLSPDGGLRSARIVRSSGRQSLDQSVLQSVFRAAPFPKPPEGLKPAQLRFLIPFEFM